MPSPLPTLLFCMQPTAAHSSTLAFYLSVTFPYPFALRANSSSPQYLADENDDEDTEVKVAVIEENAAAAELRQALLRQGGREVSMPAGVIGGTAGAAGMDATDKMFEEFSASA